MSLLLDQPVWMGVALIGGVASVLGWWLLRGVPRSRRAVVVGARAASFVCLALALAGLQSVQKTDDLTVIGVVDVSGSMKGYADLGVDDNGFTNDLGTLAMDFLSRSSKDRLDGDRLGLIAFNGRSSLVVPPRVIGGVGEISFEIPEVDGTDLPGAIRQAQSLIPSSSRGRIVLISDGVSTTGALENIATTVPVDVVPIEYKVDQEVVVESVEIPARVAPGSMLPVRVSLRSTGPARGSLRLLVDGQTINLTPDTPRGGLPVTLSGGVEPISISVPIGSGRVHRVRAVWEPELDESGKPLGDTNALNNESTALSLASDHGRVLLVSGDPDTEALPLASVLESTGWSVETVAPVEVPVDLLGLEPYDLVVLINTPRDGLMPGIESSLDHYVRTLGGGLVFVGGYEALGAGGWNASGSVFDDDQSALVADLLPVNLDIPDDVVTTHAAVMLVLDSSGSMKRPVMDSSRTQQAVANSSAASAIEVLDPSDMVGVISFSSSARLVVPITKNTNPSDTQSRINSISSGGGTNLAPALIMARDQLLNIDSTTKHIVVLSDGESQDPERLPLLAKEFEGVGIKVSTITIGDLADEKTMRLIATNSGGVYYRVVNPAVLPRIFLKAVRVLRRPMVREGVVTPVVVDRASPMLVDTGALSIPDLGGLVLTEFKSDDPRVMVPVVSSQGEPILAGHQVELGRVAVFTSDATISAGGWASKWGGSGSYDRFWSHLAQWAGRAEDPGVGELSIQRTMSSGSGGLSVSYSAIDDTGVPIDGLSVQTRVLGPDGSSRAIDLVQVGPGLYGAEIGNVPSGDHVVVATPRLDGQPIRPTIGAVHIDDLTEFDALVSDRSALESLAQRSGGRVFSLDQAGDMFSREGLAEVSSYESLWRLMLILGFALFLLDLGARRIAWDRWIAQARDETIAVSRAVRADQLGALTNRTPRTEPEVRIDPGPVRRPRPTPTTIKEADDAEIEEISGLMAAKKRARERMDES